MHLRGPAAEGEVGVAVAARRALGREALGIEAFGVFPEVGVAVGHVGAEEDERALRDVVAADLVVLSGVRA